jgi:hypothetical protein
MAIDTFVLLAIREKTHLGVKPTKKTKNKKKRQKKK